MTFDMNANGAVPSVNCVLKENVEQIKDAKRSMKL